MIVINTYNGRAKEYIRYDDILEGDVKLHQSNISPLEWRLLKINNGTKRRLKNNHKARLQRFKNSK